MAADAEFTRRASTRKFWLLTAICFIAVTQATFAAAQAGKRLILNDGTWQGITEYEVRGDRAHYFSSLRGEWEELPKELVDWPATEKWNVGLKEKSPELRQFEAEAEAEEEAGRKGEGANGPTVAPGLKLSSLGGVFVLDMFSGHSSLSELTQNGSELNNETGHNILRSPINRKAAIRQQFGLKGPHARAHVHVMVPEIFVKIDEKPNLAQHVALTDRFRILQLEPTEDSRVLGRVEVSLLGKQSQSQQFVSTRIESIGRGWLKVIPVEALEPGEYALVEMLSRNEFNSYVWDFGVDPNSPSNPNSRKPESPANDQPDPFSPEPDPQKN